MNRKFYALFSVVFVASLIITACTPAVPPPATTQTPIVMEVTRIVEGTPKVVEITTTPEVKPTELPAGSVQINGAGATFPLPVYTEWTYAYTYVDPSVAINYQGIGSGGGKKAIIDGTVDFAGSDSLLKTEEYDAGKDLQMFPILAGAVVPIYNIKWANTDKAPSAILILDRQTLVGIFNATIVKWNDPAIVALNPDLRDFLPDVQITVVHRSDGSGTTEIFTKSLSSFSLEWTAGGASSVEWPVDRAGTGIGAKGNPGVAGAVLNSPNSIGYVELSFALSNKMPFTRLVNKAGKTVEANAQSLASAMADYANAFDAKLTATIVDAPGEGSWPITGYTYLILHTTTMSDCVKAQKLMGYIYWTLTDAGAADKASSLGYAVLPSEVQKLVLAKLGEVSCKNQPILMKK
jgi:phosphate transport system substrate-binding protein